MLEFTLELLDVGRPRTGGAMGDFLYRRLESPSLVCNGPGN